MYLSKSTELFWASRVAQTVKYLPAMQETWVWSPEVENGNPLQYSCLEGYSPWGRKEPDTTEPLLLQNFTAQRITIMNAHY